MTTARPTKPNNGSTITYGFVAGTALEGDTRAVDIGGASQTPSYVVLSLDANLTNERVLVAGTALSSNDGGAGGNLTIDLDNTAVSAGSYTNTSLTVDAQGRLTAASSGTAPVTSVGATAPIATTGGTTPTISLNDTAVAAGSYTYSSITVDSKGRLTAASSGAAPVNLSGSFLLPYFGTGGDGDFIVSGLVTLTRETHYNNLTITSTGTLKPEGFRIFVKGTLTIDVGGSINDDGNPATGTPPSNGGTGLGGNRGVYGGSSTTGGNGRNTSGTGGVVVSTNVNASRNDSGVLPTGGGGGSGGGQAGANGGISSAPSPAQQWQSAVFLTGGRTTLPGVFGCGAGGGGGGCNTAGGSATSGGGGSGGGAVMVFAKIIVNNGRISANGGAGGNAVQTGTASAGGGGSGSGGLVALFTSQTTSTGIVQAAGGTAGNGAGPAGVGGLTGSSGSVVIMVLS